MPGTWGCQVLMPDSCQIVASSRCKGARDARHAFKRHTCSFALVGDLFTLRRKLGNCTPILAFHLCPLDSGLGDVGNSWVLQDVVLLIFQHCIALNCIVLHCIGGWDVWQVCLFQADTHALPTLPAFYTCTSCVKSHFLFYFPKN